MQDEINEKVVALSVKGAKLTAEMLQKAIKAMLAQAKKQQEKQPHGKQTLKQLAKQNAGLSNIEITEGNIKAFEQTAKKYGIDFALKKDSTETPPRYLVFFKGRDADALTAAFKEFSAKKLNKEQKPSSRNDTQTVIAHAVKQSIKLPPLRGLLGVIIRKEKLVYRNMITSNKVIENLQARLLSLVLDIRKIARGYIERVAYRFAALSVFFSRGFYGCPERLKVI